jgi:uncharacterized membrane protein
MASPLKDFVRNTIVGGLTFLVPVVLLGLVLRHAMEIADKVGRPIAQRFPAHAIAGVATGTIVAALLLVLVAFLAGLLARTSLGTAAAHWLENSFLGNLPPYRMVKTMADGLTQVENAEGIEPVLVSIEGGWQLGYSLEEVREGWVAVFLPQSPTPLSGNVMYLPADRVRRLDIGIPAAMKIVKHMGMGSAGSLKGIDLTPPPGS